MKRQFILFVLAAMIAALCLPPVFAQATGTVKGVCTDVEGKPIAGATVEYRSVETGRKYALKTNNKGEFFSLGVAPGKYNVALIKDGTEVFHFANVPVTLNEETNVLNFDLKKEQARAAQGQGVTPEQLKQQQEQQAKVAKENASIKGLNEKLAVSRQAMAAGNYDQAAQLDPTRASMFYFNKGAVQTNSGKVDDAIDSFKKVIATDPNKADAYYWLGVNMIGKATLKGDKMVAPEGTSEAFNKYLELQPNGPYAEPAKQMLASIGATIETTYGNKKKAKSK